MKITFALDYVCPFSYVAWEALRIAMAQTGMDAEVVCIPFELTREGKPRVDTWNDPVRRGHYTPLEAPCREMNLPAKLPPHVVPRPYSAKAFEAWHWAREQNRGDDWTDRVFRAYFEEEQDIGETDVLCRLAEGLGMDAAALREKLLNGAYREKECAAADYSRNVLRVTYVPTIHINDKLADIQDYTPEEFVRLLKRADA